MIIIYRLYNSVKALGPSQRAYPLTFPNTLIEFGRDGVLKAVHVLTVGEESQDWVQMDLFLMVICPQWECFVITGWLLAPASSM